MILSWSGRRAAQRRHPLPSGQAIPHAPGLVAGQGVCQAGRAHRAARTDGPGGSGRPTRCVVHPIFSVVAPAGGIDSPLARGWSLGSDVAAQPL